MHNLEEVGMIVATTHSDEHWLAMTVTYSRHATKAVWYLQTETHMLITSLQNPPQTGQAKLLSHEFSGI